MFSFRDGVPPSRRAYDYLEEHGVTKAYKETAPQCAVKHMIGRAWEAASKGTDPDGLRRVSDALDELIDAVDAVLPEKEDAGGERSD